ncbi:MULTISPECIES: NAD(P)/FAD-dependent oxidoreductase [Actinoalloteichus]|uniref:Pyridine nucleotide-disulfide oxidoreductase/Reductase C-terminal n=1 Tax=Actinoalloteichus fjordicus TaxID=1612552 RepID=A0AAC9L9J2_9PSEU|nr:MULTISPECIES: FAD-dependent oxidoreductase [Actinoalloteichus]APU13602.1 Pyridine nucleotide-disulfide oxidoreductase/Reductase C-terminal [Actinoalloteichus fjordicus]APU19549.1 Pyridine nucleotide-disulfide oxidoreductase/Reductase C-terminal [Actinoalloteichus sp. GBA129-24]
MTENGAAPRRIVVVGSSVAGLTVVDTVRRHGFDGAVTLIGDEVHLPYDRPPLSKQILAGDWAPERVRLRQREDLDGLDLDLRLGVTATGLDPERRRVALSDGGAAAYDRLVIATGVQPRRLPETDGVRGVHTLRTLDDAVALRAALQPDTRLVVVGAGFLGTEIAAAARRLGARVWLLEPAPTPLAAVVGTEIGGFVAELHREQGVDLRTGPAAAVRSLRVEDGAVTGVRTADGEVLPADVVAVAIGSRPAVDWLSASGLRCADGVHCDATCSAAPGVFAAGDVARWFNPRYGTEMRVEHRTNASEQARYVAGAVVGTETQPFSPVPYFWSDQYDVKIQSHGLLHGHDEVRIVAGSLPDRRFIALYRRGSRLSGVLGVGDFRALRRWRSTLDADIDWHDALSAG